MNKVLFISAFALSFLILVGGEWFIKGNTQIEHILGWIFVALFVGALVGIVFKKDKVH